MKGEASFGQYFEGPRGEFVMRVANLDRPQQCTRIDQQEKSLYQVEVKAFPAHGIIGKHRQFGIVAISPCTELPRPFPRIGFLKMRGRGGLRMLVSDFEHPLLKA